MQKGEFFYFSITIERNNLLSQVNGTFPSQEGACSILLVQHSFWQMLAVLLM